MTGSLIVLVLVCALAPDLLLFKGIVAVAQKFKVGIQHCHNERNTSQFVDLLLRTSGLNGPESKEGINQLSMFEQILKIDNKLLKRVGI